MSELLTDRARLVLKPARGSGGEGVRLGSTTTGPDWDETVREALESGAWIVQERCESRPVPLQTGVEGSGMCDIAWSTFLLGGRRSDAFVRAKPFDERGAIVNVGSGAELAVSLYVDE